MSVYAREIKDGQMPAGDGVVRGGVRFMNKTDLQPPLNAVTSFNQATTISAQFELK